MSDPIYVKAPRKIPANTFQTGWPQKLIATDSTEYWRLRDGIPANDSSGEEVLYGRIVGYDEAEGMPIISTAKQYMIDPATFYNVKGGKGDRLLLLETIWATNEQLGTNMEETFLLE